MPKVYSFAIVNNTLRFESLVVEIGILCKFRHVNYQHVNKQHVTLSRQLTALKIMNIVDKCVRNN